jgi:two-component system, cell cycle sensor histidine kinase and response regulator CckA
MRSHYRLLLIEGNPTDRRVILRTLNKLGSEHQAECADSLSIGKELLARGDFDAVLVDLVLPDSRGLETLEGIHSADPLVPVVVLSSVDDQALAVRAVRAGAQDYVLTAGLNKAVLGRSLRYAIERKRGEEALRVSEARTRALLDAIPDAMFRIHHSGRFLDFKPPKEASTSAFSVDLLDRDLEDALPPTLAEQYRRHLVKALESSETQLFEYEHRTKGEERHYEVRLVACGADEALAIIRDVTESRRLEEQLRLSQRLEAVGRLAGGVAHDFNNYLTVIGGNAELALLQPPSDSEIRLALDEIKGAAERAATVTRQLLAFSRKQVLKPVPLDLNDLVLGTEKMLRRLIGEDIELVTKPDSEFSTVRADPAQMEQVLMNLAVNSRDAMPKGGKLLFETADVEVYETYVGQEVEVASGSYVVLSVSDTGTGMNAATKARAFEPFFTTKGRSKGTGLGLSTVYGIVKQSGGYIWIYSEIGLGTTIKIYLPSLDCPAVYDARRTEVRVEEGRGETILLVEDDPKVLQIGQRFLSQAGYHVIPAEGITSALELVANYGETIHLLATDVILPTMSGRDLAERLQSMRPDIRTLYLSGYTDDAIAQHGVLDVGVAFLEKPYDRLGLLAAVRRALDDAR